MQEDRSNEPRSFLADRLDALWQAAGTPTLDSVARAAQGTSPRPTGKLTGKKISAWKTGANVPQAFTELESVVRVLIQKARRLSTAPSSPGLFEESQWRKWWSEARSFPPQWRDSSGPAVGQAIDKDLDPFDLEVHRAIDDEKDGLVPRLPAYLEREHDDRLRVLVDRAQARSTIAVLVGGSSTGKTRSCWEAIQGLRGWRLWHPVNPSRPQALIDALDKGLIQPRTVLWLNELQHYLKDQLGESIAAGLREIIRDPRKNPLLVLGTLWPEHWNTLTRTPTIGEPDKYSQCRALLIGHRIKVPDAFNVADVAELPAHIKSDQRIIRALNRPDKRVTQFLAGAFELLSRYETAPPAARALIDFAIDASRFGLGSEVSETLLKNAAPGYLSDYEWNELNDDWLAEALAYSQKPSLGVSGPLAKMRPRSGDANTESSLYRLADFLEETGRRSRRYIMPSATFWNTITDHATADSLVDLAYELQYKGRYRDAARLYFMAADAGDINALLYLADNRRRVGDVQSAEAVLKIAMARGSMLAYVDVAELRHEAGDAQAAKQVLREILLDNPVDFEDRGHAWRVLIDLCEETGDIMTPRRWLKQAVADEDDSAAAILADMGKTTRRSKALSRLQKTAIQVLRSENRMERAHKDMIRLSRINDECFYWSLRYFEERTSEAEQNDDDADALIMLGRVHAAHGNTAIAEAILLKAINVLKDPPYTKGKVPALVELVKILKRNGSTDAASQLWKYGLELDGRISNPWDVLDQIPQVNEG